MGTCVYLLFHRYTRLFCFALRSPLNSTARLKKKKKPKEFSLSQISDHRKKQKDENELIHVSGE